MITKLSLVKAASSHDQNTAGSQLAPEKDKMPSGLLAIFIVALVVLLVVVGVVAKQILWKVGEAQRTSVAGQPENAELLELRAAEEAVLESYDVVDQQKGLYRIPIEQAIDLYVRTQGQK